PALLITADLDKGAIYPPDDADALTIVHPAFQHVHISGAGHSIRREQPEAFVKAVREFLYAP
ncbi:MAG TPA: hypothetical protein PK530_12480, partial [Anaerolineales bacterium]|nr:hypothetical protein [Anaerolineales bacterium]